PKGLDKLSTIQETEIIIFLPNQVEILIENSFGNTSIQDHQGKVAVESKYGELKLANLTGEVKINSTFGDLEVSNFSGSMTCDLEHTATKIEGFTGDASVKTNLGDIVFTGIEELLRLKISAEKSDVILQFNKNNVDSYYWDIRSKYGEISFPNSGIEGKKISFGDDGNPAIYVSTDFGKITIK
ncbi:MAG: DUF4097 family beta strand repeat protein, partial [Ekhidna sp.]|nr:DUF4097 family beta strand repeat protein [Ekhidna sp.]